MRGASVDLRRAVGMALFFIRPPDTVATRLQLEKLPYFADLEAFKRYGAQISTMKYDARDLGPVPLYEGESILNHHYFLQFVDVDDITEKGRPSRRYTLKEKYDFGDFSPNDFGILNYVFQNLRHKSGEALSDLSHKQGQPWQVAYAIGKHTPIDFTVLETQKNFSAAQIASRRKFRKAIADQKASFLLLEQFVAKQAGK